MDSSRRYNGSRSKSSSPSAVDDSVRCAINASLRGQFRLANVYTCDRPTNKYAFMGPHCIGKSTLISNVTSMLRKAGFNVQVIDEHLEKIQEIVTRESPVEGDDKYHTVEMTRMLSDREKEVDPAAQIVLIDRYCLDSVMYSATLEDKESGVHLVPKNLSERTKHIVGFLKMLQEKGLAPIDCNIVHCKVEGDDDLRRCYDLIGHRGRDWELVWPFSQYKELYENGCVYINAVINFLTCGSYPIVEV